MCSQASGETCWSKFSSNGWFVVAHNWSTTLLHQPSRRLRPALLSLIFCAPVKACGSRRMTFGYLLGVFELSVILRANRDAERAALRGGVSFRSL